MEAKSRHVIMDLIRFCIVGIISVTVQFIILIIGVEIFDFNPTVFSGLGFLAACVFNYLALYYWAFDSTGKHHIIFFRYLVVMCFTMSLNVYIFWLFTEGIGTWYILSQAIATGCSAMFSFLLNRNYTFV